MGRVLFLFYFLVVSFCGSQAKNTIESDSVRMDRMYLVWNDNSYLRDSLQIKKVISYYKESRYIDELVTDGQVKHLLSVEKLSRFKRGDEERFMFLFNDPHFEPSETRKVAAISFQGNDVLGDLIHEMKYITLDTKFNPSIYAEFMPSFNGGYSAMMKYLNEKVNLSQDVIVGGSCSAVVLGFVVGKDGSVKDLKILEDCNDVLDREAYRLVESMPKWQPGSRGGSSVPIFVVLQLIFKD